MHRTFQGFSRRAALAAAALGAVAASFIAGPSPGQQSQPALSVLVPANAGSGPDTRVGANFTLPPGIQRHGNPRVRVTDAQGQLLELLPMYLTPGTTAAGAYRDLHTELYPPGIYQVRVEIDVASAAAIPSTDGLAGRDHDRAGAVARAPVHREEAVR